MKKIKSTGKVGRSSFFDRIKTDTHEQSMKENVNINHIKQSSYKLDRSKSYRKDHSLQRKIPIISTRTQEHRDDTSFREGASRGNTVSLTPHAFTTNVDHQLKDDKSKEEDIGKSFRELFGILQISKKKDAVSEHFDSNSETVLNLEQQKSILDLVKVMWSTVIKMKDNSYFKEETAKIEGVLKLIVLKLAKPKLSILEEHSSMSFKVPPFKYSSPGNIISIRDESKPQSKQKVEPSYRQCRKNEEVPGEELEFKKIMYILEESHKLSLKDEEPLISEARTVSQKNHPQPHNQLLNFFNEGPTLPLKRNKSHLSSFVNSQSTRTNGIVVYEQQKIQDSSSDRLFLKNIVKKAKSNRSDKENHPVKLKTEGCCQTASNGHTFSSLSISEAQSSKTAKSHQLSDQYLSSIISDSVEHPSLSNNTSVHLASHSSENYGTSEREKTVEIAEDSESKRATLNNIISMLNSKYNKNIKFEPKKGV